MSQSEHEPLLHGYEKEESRKFEALLYEVSTTFIDLPADGVDAAVTRVLERIAKALRLDRVSLSQLSPDRSALAFTHFWAAPGVEPLPLPIVATEKFPRAAELVLSGDDFMFERLEEVPADFVLERAFFEAQGTKSHLTVPLILGGVVLGGLSCGALRRSRRWPRYVVRRVRLLGQILANALARKGSAEMLQERARALKEGRKEHRRLAERLLVAQEEERSRIARELHDDVNQRLALLTVMMEQLRQQTPRLATDQRAGLSRLVEDTKGLLSDMEHLSHRLHPSKLDQLGLMAALRGLCREVSHEQGMEITFTSRDVPSAIPKEIALCFYRIAQEALRNVVRHSRAREARVELDGAQAELVLRVVDSGDGFDLARVREDGGLGLVSMEERAHLVGGALTIESEPSRGTRVEVRASLDRDT